jgi:two-component system response regulator AtoC
MSSENFPILNLLVVDDRGDILTLIEAFTKSLKPINFQGFTSQMKALEWANTNSFDAALIDYVMPEETGITLIQNLRKINPEAYFVLMSAHADLDKAIEAIRLDVFDFLVKPFSLQAFEFSMNRILDHRNLKNQNLELRRFLRETFGLGDLIGQSELIQKIKEKIKTYAESDYPVLIHGETGVGKEVVARLIHQNSPRGKSKFVAVNCSSFSESLLESELFGHEKGAFTGADRKRVGRFEFAGEGTIFLDEISEIPTAMQVKLLRVLEQKEFERVGGNETIKLKARIVSATNADLKKKIESGEFREDLFYRINALPIHIAPLRNRKEDVHFLAKHFLKMFNLVAEKNIQSFDPETLATLTDYHWPGNVRQLQNVVNFSALHCDSDTISLDHLPEEVRGNWPKPSVPIENFKLGQSTVENIKAVASDLEKKSILQALQKNKGNKSRTAKDLGLTRSQLLYKLKKFNI